MGHTSTNDIIIVIGKPENSDLGYVYIETHNKAISRLGAFVLNRGAYLNDEDFLRVYEKAKPIFEALLADETTLGIHRMHFGLNFISPEIETHYIYLLDLYITVALKAIQEAFDDLPLDVYVIKSRFSESDLSAFQRAFPGAAIVLDEKELNSLLYKKTHSTA